MLVTLLGMTVVLQPIIRVLLNVSIIALQLLRESYVEFPLSTMIVFRPLQFANAKPSMFVTLLEMVTEVRLLQP